MDAWVLADGGTSSLAEAVDNVDDTGWEADLEDQAGDVQSGELVEGKKLNNEHENVNKVITYRSLFSRLQDDSVAASEGRAELPRQHEKRIVPWNDLTAYADGLHAGEAEDATIGGDGLAVNLVGPAGIILETGDRAVNIELSLGDGLAVIESLELGDVVLVLGDQVGELGDHGATGRSLKLTPGRGELESLSGGLHGKIDIGGIALGNVTDLLLSSRVEAFERLAGNGVNEFVVDEKLFGEREENRMAMSH